MTTAAKVTTQKLSPLDVARETIKQMALRRVEPNPENYQLIYNEIAGIKNSPTLHHAIQKSLKSLPRETTGQIAWLNRWEKMLQQNQWEELPALLSEGLEAKVGMSEQWPVAIRDLLRAWDAKHAELDIAKKKETLERVLIKFGNDEQLAKKIQSLAQTWLQGEKKNALLDMVEVLDTPAAKPSRESITLTDEISPKQHQASTTTDSAQVSKENKPPLETIAKTENAVLQESDAEQEPTANVQNQQLFDMFNTLKDIYKQSVKHGLIPRLEGYPEMEAEAIKLLSEAEKARKFKEWQLVAKHFRALLVRVEVIGANEQGIRDDIMRLLKLLVENVSELVAEDQWLRGQVAVIQTILSSPLDRAQIKNAEKSLKEIIYKQGLLKHNLADARTAFKTMLATFVDRLSHMSQTSGDYQEKISDYSTKLSDTDDIFKINEILENIMADTQVMQTDIVHSRELLIAQRDEVMTSQDKIRQLQSELTQLSEVVRVDQLTGVLNRRGLDDAIVREVARVNRTGNSLAIAMLDVDNFKNLNDTHGHHVGDSALQHLATVIQDTLRPTDIISRFGGEEFVILLPDTNMTEAKNAVTRLQRTLTKRFFMGNNERLLITFSAGISIYRKDEDQITAINRADQAMYFAKKTGKNKVMTEHELEAKIEIV